MIFIKIFCKEKFITTFSELKEYPFDAPTFNLKFELSHLHLDSKGETYRFNYLRTTKCEFKWVNDCDFLPEFDIDYVNTSIRTLEEYQYCSSEKFETKEKICYHHGFVLSFTSVRNPKSKVIKYLLTAQAINLFLLCVYNLPIEIESLGKKLECIAVGLLTFVNLLSATRDEIPSL